MIQLHGDYRELDDELDRLSSLPGRVGKAKLDAVLDYGFDMSQESVHVRTGSLKSSGKTTSRLTKHTWRGKISYGGPSAGVNNPVDYAIYEYARGGAHEAFIENLHLLNSMYIAAIMDILKND